MEGCFVLFNQQQKVNAKLGRRWGSLLNSSSPQLPVLPEFHSSLTTVSERHRSASKNGLVQDFLKHRTTQKCASLGGRKIVCLLTVEHFTQFKK